MTENENVTEQGDAVAALLAAPIIPTVTFDSFPIADDVKSALTAMGYIHPTPVQIAVLTPGLAGKDLVVQAKTGSGKTTAFGIPLIQRITAGSGTSKNPKALVLAPTRELAHQVAAEVEKIGLAKGVKVTAIYGGVPIGRQAAALTTGTDIVVGTPGRLLDHIRRGNFELGGLEFIVLDEADEMLSIGFWDDVTDLLEKSPKNTQIMLFSATLPYQIAKAAAQYLKEPERVDLSGDDMTVRSITNVFVQMVPDLPKPRQLLYLLEHERPTSAVIFCNTRNETEMIAKYLTQAGFVSEALTGNFRQNERERVMGRIKDGSLKYMVATDIAARGIDIDKLSHVFNYALPEFVEVYLHRVGRTGRIGNTGRAISLVDGKGYNTLTQLQRQYGIEFTEAQLPPEAEAQALRSARIMKDLSDKASVAEVGQHLPVAEEILKSDDAQQLVAFLLKSYFNSQSQVSSRASEDYNAGDGGGDGRNRPPRNQNARRGGAGASAPARSSGDAPRDRPAASAASNGDAAVAGEPADQSARRRRRRGGRRGKGSDGGQSSKSAFDTMDVSEALAGDNDDVREADIEKVTAAIEAPPSDGLTRIRVNIGFDDGFKGRGAVAKKVSALAGINEGIVMEVESRRRHAVLKTTPEIAELLVDRVDGAQIGKKVVSLSIATGPIIEG